MPTTQAEASQQVRTEGGKFLTFILGEEEYGSEILKVREINRLLNITTVPQTPDFMKGVINLRGKVIPVIDLRLKFGLPEAEYTEETCIIVVDINEMLIGVIVDRVSEVLDISKEDIEPPPSLGTAVKTDFIIGMGKAKGKIVILLDIAKVVSEEEVQMLSDV